MMARMGSTWSFRDSWTLAAPRRAVFEVLVDLERYPEWWPQVLAVARVSQDRARVLCRSRLPYTLDLWVHAVHRREDLLETRLAGDLDGWARWRLTQVAGVTELLFEQEVVIARRSLAPASYLLGGVLRWNHDAMMAGCLAGLEARVRRRQG